MAVVIECSYVYENLEWAVVNEYSDGLKRECLMDPDNVDVSVDKQADGSTSYLYTGKVSCSRRGLWLSCSCLVPCRAVVRNWLGPPSTLADTRKPALHSRRRDGPGRFCQPSVSGWTS